VYQAPEGSGEGREISVSSRIRASCDWGVPVGAGDVVVDDEDAGGASADGLVSMRPLRLVSMTWMAPIMALALFWSDDGLDYTIHDLSGHHTLAEMPAHTHRRAGEPATGTDTVPLVHFSFNGRSKCESWQSC